MNVIFLTMSRIADISQRGIYTDLMHKFRNEGHNVYIVTPFERSLGQPTKMIEKDGMHVLGIKTLNLQKTSAIEKGLGQVLIEFQYKRAIKKYFVDIKFDLILYSTPPITFPNVISFLKKQNPNAKTYLLLKDIFPQNAVDMGMLNDNGYKIQGSSFMIGWIKFLLYKYFKRKEKDLYAQSDYIGCMSPANVEFVLKNNPEIDASRVEVAPNSIELRTNTEYINQDNKIFIRTKYGLPLEKPIFIYGGNLGKPQGIPYLIDCLEANANRRDCHFVIVGSGTEFPRLKEWYTAKQPKNITLMKGLPKADYDLLVCSCDVGMIFLDHRFTIPNYPSRLLSYLENKMPVICATDPNTDIGRIAENNGYGFWCESNSVDSFSHIVNRMIQANRNKMGEKGFDYMKENYLVENTYNTIIAHSH